ncbi:hypothetical protein [Lysobacter brunescens]|uniref:Secreted protein n=1 Tax=Lysobacter brunescens TaxID=262323 RepID=A0ABW2Y7F4_9GAMM
MIRRAIVPVLATVCGIAACQSPTAPPLVDAAPVETASDARAVASDEAASLAPMLSPLIEEARNRAHRDDMLALADDVAAQGDARALALAATLRGIGLWRETPQSGPDQAGEADAKIRQWLDEAERMAPEDVTALVLSMGMIERDQARRAALIARWRRLEPDNLAPILHADQPESALFEAAAAADVFDDHYDDAMRAGIDILSRTSSPALSRLRSAAKDIGPEGHDAVMVIGFHAASVMPAFQRVSTPCRAEGIDEVRLRQCDRIARTLMQHGGSMIAERIGTAMLRRLPTSSASDRAAADAMDRESDWLVYRSGELSQRDLRAYMARFVDELRAFPQIGERELMRKLLQASGVPTAPPPGWRKAQDPAFPVATR